VLAGLGLEAVLRAGEPALDRRERGLARGGDLGELHPVDEPEREGDALVRRERVQHRIGRPERVAHLARCRVRRDLRQLLARQEPEPAPAPAPRDRRLRHVHRDHGEPALERARVVEPFDRGEGADEDAVVQVREIGVEAEDAIEHAMHVIGVPVVERRARPRIPAAKPVHERHVVPCEGDLRGRRWTDERERMGQARAPGTEDFGGGAPQLTGSSCSWRTPWRHGIHALGDHRHRSGW
jgi:hypothetical protein